MITTSIAAVALIGVILLWAESWDRSKKVNDLVDKVNEIEQKCDNLNEQNGLIKDILKIQGLKGDIQCLRDALSSAARSGSSPRRPL